VDAPHHGDAVLNLLPAVWFVLVLAGAWHRRPLPARAQALLGSPPPVRWRRPSPVARRWGGAVAAALVALAILPVVAPVAAAAAWALPVLRARRRRGDASAAVRRDLPETIELLRLGVGAGLNVPLAVEAAGRRGSGPIADELRSVAAQARAGRACADALDIGARRLGDLARPLFAALIASDRYGAPLAEPLARLAAEARADRLRHAEEAARRIPVRLLFPLVLCVLPAFALLTVTPLIAGGLRSLRP